MKPLIVALCLALFLAAAPDDPAVIAQRVADTERQLPWFWSPISEGFSDVPYTFQMTQTKSFTSSSGKPSKAPSSLHLERIPLPHGQYFRCLQQDGDSPCSAAIVNAFEQDAVRAANFTPQEKANARAAGEERRARRQAFWKDFPIAFKFEQTGPGEIAFTPTGKYHPLKDPNTELLARIKGRFQFDPDTFEITRLEYHMLQDAEIIARLYKGSTFSVTLQKAADNHYVPVVQHARRPLPKGGVETSEFTFSDYRAFAADSSITFVDK